MPMISSGGLRSSRAYGNHVEAVLARARQDCMDLSESPARHEPLPTSRILTVEVQLSRGLWQRLEPENAILHSSGNTNWRGVMLPHGIVHGATRTGPPGQPVNYTTSKTVVCLR